LTPDLFIDLPDLRVEAHGPTIAIFAKFRNGSVYRDEYASVSLQAIHLYDEIAPPNGATRPDVRLFEAIIVRKFTQINDSIPGQIELATYFSYVYSMDRLLFSRR
jgi:hypothetical protein